MLSFCEELTLLDGATGALVFAIKTDSVRGALPGRRLRSTPEEPGTDGVTEAP